MQSRYGAYPPGASSSDTNWLGRHYEAGKSPVQESRRIDYLFHRLSAMIWLIVSSRAATK